MQTNLTQSQIDKIQYDEGVAYVNFEETDERMLGPVRGGIEFTAEATIHDIEHDGRKGKEAGLQVIDEQKAKLKLKTLSCTQEDLLLALPGAELKIVGEKKVLQNSKCGLIQKERYLKNITVFAKTIDGQYKKITMYNALHEGAFTFACKPKSENENNLEFDAHYDALDKDKLIWEIEDIEKLPIVTEEVVK